MLRSTIHTQIAVMFVDLMNDTNPASHIHNVLTMFGEVVLTKNQQCHSSAAVQSWPYHLQPMRVVDTGGCPLLASRSMCCCLCLLAWSLGCVGCALVACGLDRWFLGCGMFIFRSTLVVLLARDSGGLGFRVAARSACLLCYS